MLEARETIKKNPYAEGNTPAEKKPGAKEKIVGESPFVFRLMDIEDSVREIQSHLRDMQDDLFLLPPLAEGEREFHKAQVIEMRRLLALSAEEILAHLKAIYNFVRQMEKVGFTREEIITKIRQNEQLRKQISDLRLFLRRISWGRTLIEFIIYNPGIAIN